MPEAAAGAPAAPGPRGVRGTLPWLLAGALGLAGAALLPALSAAAGPAPPSFCPSRLLFGLPCPGCGMTRALAALLRGDLAAALAFHPWAPALAAQLVLGWAAWGWRLVRRAARPALDPAAWLGPLLLANLAALAALWLGRLSTGTLP